ncbi:MAG: alanine:cation symporter family protein [Phycisphaerales bacterium]|nr:MAG: alanine:cation symporter family protein [Phycisphaerales bacterium]
MPNLEQLTSAMANWVWSVPLFFLLLGCGLVFSVFAKFVQWRIMTHGYACIRGHYDRPEDTGHISHFQALCAALSATIGLGNIAGVAVAISVGGPGAIFWMWIVGVFGMALKFMECSLAVMFRDVRDVPDPSAPALMEADAEQRTLEYRGEPPPEPGARPRARGEVRGGPMWYMQKALVEPLRLSGNPAWVLFKILAVCFAVATMLNSFGGGNMFQGWNVSDQLHKQCAVPNYIAATLVSGLVALVIIGGIKRIGEVASRLVPFMCVVYVLGALYVIVIHADEIPKYLALIVNSAFTPVAESGACAGVVVWLAFKHGLRRACFSNEAGEGSAAMAHAAARTEEPIREGVVAGIGPFVDTIVICTMSAMVLLMSGTWERPPVGAIASIDGDRAVVRTGDTMPPNMEGLYLERMVVDSKNLAIHVLRRRDQELEFVSAPITSIDRGDGEGWEALKSVSVDLSELAELDRERVAVGQHVHLDMDGAELTGFAFDTTMKGFGKYMVTLAVCLFGFSTMISWSYYGEKGAEYLLGPQAILPYKFLFVIFVFLGMVLPKFQTVYDFSDATTGLMVLCNLPAVLILSPVVLRAARAYFRRLDAGEMPRRFR